jgi:DNA-directed RNA polymerase omega subunit
MRSQKSVHELAEEVGGMYALVVAAAKRAKQIREGRQPVTSTDSSNPLTIALQELLDGKIVVRPPGEKEETEAGSEAAEVSSGEGEAETEEAEEADDEETAEEDE